MLGTFIISNRDAIIAHARARVGSRTWPSDVDVADGIPLFLDQLSHALRAAGSRVSVDHDPIRESAARHGRAARRMRFTIAQVVHEYADAGEAIAELAMEQRVPISSEEFLTLNLCLDHATAHAVTEYSREGEHAIADQATERLGMLAHEMRNLLNTAILSFESIKGGEAASGGSTSAIHARSLHGLRILIDRSLADVRIDAGIERMEPISAMDLSAEIELGAALQAKARGLHFAVTSVDRAVTVHGDRQILVAAVSNLLQNAFKFTRKEGNVALTTRATADRVLFEVQDECGGLPPGKTEGLFRSFEQRGSDRSGVGLGLSICLKAARANGGDIRVRDLPGKGCVFTLDLPRTLDAGPVG